MKNVPPELDQALAPARFIDSGTASVLDFAKRKAAGAGDDREAAIRLYTAVRDEIDYDPYVDFADPLIIGRAACWRPVAVFASARRRCWLRAPA